MEIGGLVNYALIKSFSLVACGACGLFPAGSSCKGSRAELDVEPASLYFGCDNVYQVCVLHASLYSVAVCIHYCSIAGTNHDRGQLMWSSRGRRVHGDRLEAWQLEVHILNQEKAAGRESEAALVFKLAKPFCSGLPPPVW